MIVTDEKMHPYISLKFSFTIPVFEILFNISRYEKSFSIASLLILKNFWSPLNLVLIISGTFYFYSKEERERPFTVVL